MASNPQSKALSAGVPIELRAPSSDESLLTNKEKIILLKSSKLHGSVFPPWKADPTPEEFAGEFVDHTEFRLSVEQSEALGAWRKPTDGHVGLAAGAFADVDLVQDITTDCSVVASLCAESVRGKKLGVDHSTLFKDTIFPRKHVQGNSKYIFKLHFNGCFRKVVVDDRLPESRSDRRLHVVDRNNPQNLLPALIEKAYLKVRGGYDFPGSNPGTDLWTLTGWIPEQLFLQSEDVVPQVFWRRILKAFNYGDVIFTLGTDNLSADEEQVLGLAGGHAYAVIDLKGQDDRQLLLIKNPWSEGGTWNGFIDPSNPCLRTQPDQPTGLAPGTFWMDLYNVIQYFQTVFLNWNPGLFKFRRDVHFSWDLSVAKSTASLINSPQYLIQSQKGGTLFLVLTRHFHDHDVDQSTHGESSTCGYLSLCTFQTRTRLIIPQRPLFYCHFIDAPNVLLRLELQPNEQYVVVASEQGLLRRATNFTISAFSINPLTKFLPAPERHSHNKTLTGAWTKESACGNVIFDDHDSNPQYSLRLTETSDIAILLDSENQDYAVHVKLLWADGKRAQMPISASQVRGESGDYAKGCALAEIRSLQPGAYTILCSTFEAGQIGAFNLRVSSMTSKIEVKPLPPPDAGMIARPLPNAVFSRGVDRLLAPIEAARSCRLLFRTQTMVSRSRSPASPLRLSIEFGQGPNKRTVFTTAEFASRKQLRTQSVDVTPKMCAIDGPGVWLVIERAVGAHEGQVEEVEVAVLSDVPGVDVGPWGMESNVPIEQLQEQLKRTAIAPK